jgi:undecaprenyl-diphosphatase
VPLADWSGAPAASVAGACAGLVANCGVSFLEAVVLGLIQGLTEFLPISSSGHLRVAPALFGWDDPGTAFTAVVQLGTMAAVLIYFRSDLWRIGRAWVTALWTPALRGGQDVRLGWYLIVATIPISVLGLAFSDQIETGVRDVRLVAVMLIGFGLVMAIADRVGSRSRTIDEVTTRDGVAIGFAQALALVPGVSRSGATISAGLFLGYTRADAARFSFLLSVPAVVLSGLFQLRGITGGDGPGVMSTLVATVVAFVAGYASIAWLLRWLTSHTLTIFVIYRLVLGVVLLGLVAAGTISAT